MKKIIYLLFGLFAACANPYKYALPSRPVYIGIKQNYYKTGPLPDPDSAQMVRLTNAHLHFLKEFEKYGSIKLFDLRNGGHADTLDYEIQGYIHTEITEKNEPRYTAYNYLKDTKKDTLIQNFIYYQVNYRDFERKELQTNMDSLIAYYKNKQYDLGIEEFLPIREILLPINQKKISPWYGFKGIKSWREDRREAAIISNLINNAFVIHNYRYPKPMERGDGYNYIPLYLHRGYHMSKKARKRYILTGRLQKTPNEYIIHFSYSGDKVNLVTPRPIGDLRLDRKAMERGDYHYITPVIRWYVRLFQLSQQLL